MSSVYRIIATLSLIVGLTMGIVAPTTSYAQFGGEQDDADQSTQENFEEGVVMCAGTAVILYLVGLIPGLSVPTVDTPELVKEAIFDCVFWAFKNAIIQEVTGSTVQWVQTGFGGNPAFVQNINQYLLSLADQVSADYIEETAAFLCSPFRAEIELQLTLLYRDSSGRTPPPTCSLGDVIDNVDRFLEGDFAAGGWNGWLNMTLSPHNNYFGAYLEARGELAARIQTTTGTAEKKLTLGSGFFSKEVQKCYATTPSGVVETSGPEDRIEGAEDYYCDAPQIVTPGTQIKNSLEQAFETNLDQIATADEFNEIFSLIAAYIIADILTEDEGLAGYDPSKISHELPDVVIPSGGSGGGDTTQAGPPGPSMCFVSSGTFIPQREGGRVFGTASFPLPHNVTYDQLLFEVDVKNTGLRSLDEQPPSPNGTRPWVYNIFYLPRTPGANDVFGYVNVRGNEGPNNYANKVIMQQGVITPWPNKPSVTGNLVFPVGATYTFKYLYDGAAGSIELVVTDKNSGEVKGRLQMEPDVPLNVGTKQYSVDLGFPLHSGNIYDTPSYGWEYSNLKAQFLSTGDTPDACSAITIRGSSGNSTGSGSGGSGGPGGVGSGGVGSGNPLNPNETPCPPDNPSCVGPTGGSPGGGFGGGSGGGGGTNTPPPSPPPPAPGECGEFGCHI